MLGSYRWPSREGLGIFDMVGRESERSRLERPEEGLGKGGFRHGELAMGGKLEVGLSW
jgi:hypothetical protein